MNLFEQAAIKKRVFTLWDQAIAAMQTLHTQLDEMSSLLAESQRQAA